MPVLSERHKEREREKLDTFIHLKRKQHTTHTHNTITQTTTEKLIELVRSELLSMPSRFHGDGSWMQKERVVTVKCVSNKSKSSNMVRPHIRLSSDMTTIGSDKQKVWQALTETNLTQAKSTKFGLASLDSTPGGYELMEGRKTQHDQSTHTHTRTSAQLPDCTVTR